MFKDINSFRLEAANKIEEFDRFTAERFSTEEVRADHICYKCESKETFESIRELFESESIFVYQSIISSRRICYIKFKEPLKSIYGPIWFLELSDQKIDGSQKNSFDHIEVNPVSITYEAMVSKLAESMEVIHIERPHHITDDVVLKNGLLFRCSREPLVDKIKREEMS